MNKSEKYREINDLTETLKNITWMLSETDFSYISDNHIKDEKTLKGFRKKN